MTPLLRPSRLTALTTLLILTTALRLSATAPQFCANYLGRLSEVLSEELPIAWPSAHLKPGALSARGAAAATRVREIVEQVYDPTSELGKEMDRHFSAALQKDTGWLNDYFRSYEVFYYSPEYHEVVRLMHEALPPSGRILDVGSSTGGMGLFMAEGAPLREITFLDNPQAVKLAEQRYRRLFPGQERRFSTLAQHLNFRAKIDTPPLTAAIINHVLYIMPHKTKKATLTALHDRLPEGGTVVVNEPLKGTAGVEEHHKRWLSRVMETAVANGAPHTEFDVAFLAAMSSGRATKALRSGAALELPLLTEAEHEALFRESGFEVVKKAGTYDGFSRFWVLRKVPGATPVQ